MVQGSMSNCISHSHQHRKGRMMVFITVPKVPNFNSRRHKDGACKQEKKSFKNVKMKHRCQQSTEDAKMVVSVVPIIKP